MSRYERLINPASRQLQTVGKIANDAGDWRTAIVVFEVHSGFQHRPGIEYWLHHAAIFCLYRQTLPQTGTVHEKVVPTEGVEPTHPHGYQILSLARLPIPPRRHVKTKYISMPFEVNQFHALEFTL